MKKNKIQFLLIIGIILLVAGNILVQLNFAKPAETATAHNSNTIAKRCNTVKPISSKLQCWEVHFDDILKKKDTARAFQVVTEISNIDSTFSANCHDFVHRIGEVTADLYMDNTNVSFSKNASSCGFGFYHGFMGSLLKENISIEEISTLCEKISKEFPVSVEDACYHGIGHGTFALSSPEMNNDKDQMIQKALELCEQITNKEINVSRCVSGLFMEATVGEYSISLDKNDPLSFCFRQQPQYQLDCFTQMNGALLILSQNNFNKAASYIEEIPNEHYAIEAIQTLTANYVLSTNENYREVIHKCGQLQERLYTSCIKGIILSILLNEQPEGSFNEAMNFCINDLSSEKEKNQCLEYTLQQGKNMNSKDSVRELCAVLSREKNISCDKIEADSNRITYVL